MLTTSTAKTYPYGRHEARKFAPFNGFFTITTNYMHHTISLLIQTVDVGYWNYAEHFSYHFQIGSAVYSGYAVVLTA